MPDDKVIAQLRYDFLVAALTELRALASFVVEQSQAMLQNEIDPSRKRDLAIIHTHGQEMLDYVEHLSPEPAEPGHWMDDPIYWHADIWRPASVIVGYAELLLRGSSGLVDEAQERALMRIKASGRAAHRVTAQFRQAIITEGRRAVIRTGGPDTADLGEAGLKETLERFVFSPWQRELMEAQSLDGLPQVGIASAHEVSMALGSLAAALRGNSVRGKIVLTAGCDGGTITIRLENAGFALPDAVLEELKRASSAATLFACRRFDEALDLCIGQAIIQIHGGKMRLGSRAEGGSQIAFTWPAVRR